MTFEEDFFYKGDTQRPTFDFRLDGFCVISGNSRPDDINLDEIFSNGSLFLKYLVKKNTKINFIFDFDYFNTGTQRYIHRLLDILQKSECQVIWNYVECDEDMKELGEWFQEMYSNMKIELRKK